MAGTTKRDLACQNFEGPFRIVCFNHQAAGMLVRAGCTVGVGNVDVCLSQRSANSGQFAGLIQNFEYQDFLFHYVELLLFQEKKGLCGVVYEEANHGIIHGIVDGQRKNVDPRFGKDGTGPSKETRAIL